MRALFARWIESRRDSPSTLPLVPMQPLLKAAMGRVLRGHPGLTDRLQEKANTIFLIDPSDLPFVFILRLDPHRPLLCACRRDPPVRWDARIAGRISTLIDLADGRIDGDAMFFTRDLIVEGDTEAVVCLRHAMDDQEEGVMDDFFSVLGPGKHLVNRLRTLRAQRDRS